MNWKVLLIIWLVFTNTNAQPVIVGTPSGNPPLSYLVDNKNHFYGFEVELMNDICRRMDVQCEFKTLVVGNILEEFASGKIDFAIAAIIAPDTPMPNFVFSLPYLQSGGQFMTLKESKINNPGDIKGKTVGVRRGTLHGGNLFREVVLTIYDQQIKVIDYPTMHDLLLGLSNNEVDVIFSNELPIKYWYHQNQELYKLIGTEIPFGNNYSIMASNKYKMQMALVNHALLDMIADGTYLKIYNNYFSFLQHKAK